MQKWVDRLTRGRGPGSQGEAPHDLLQALLDSPLGQDRQALGQEVITMALLGHETTANLLSWTVAELAQHPEFVQRWRETMLTNPQEGERLTRNAVKETTRLHAPNYLLSRQAKHDLNWETSEGTVSIPAGTQVLMALQPLNRATANGDVWNPDREGSKIYSFGGGQRVCLGQILARQEAHIIVREMLSRFDLEALDSQPLQPLSDLATRPQGSHYRLHPRQENQVQPK